MSRVLMVCPEPIAHGQPAGIGIRFLEIAKVLRGDGHTVTLLTPDGGAELGLTPENIHRESGANDVAFVQGHVANELFAHARPLPTVVDLYDPFIVENLHYFASRGAEVFAHDHATLVQSLLRGDFFLCASEAQRLFYLGALLVTGRLNPIAFERDPHLDSLIAIAPFGVDAARPLPQRDLANPAILFGGIYDWYDPLLAIEAVALARATHPRLTLTFTRHPNPDVTPQGKLAEALRHVEKQRHDFVKFEAWFPYASRGELFDRFTLALLTFPQSVETDLSMRTRVYDYLWGGLPIVTSSAPGTDELIARYGAGTIVRSDDSRAFAAAIDELLDAQRYAEATRGTRAFIDEHQWPRTLEPLRAFCHAPRFDETKERFATRPAVPPQPVSMLDRIRRRIARAGGSR